MTVLTEAMLRSALSHGAKTYEVQSGDYVTAPARLYAKEQGIQLQQASYGTMTVSPMEQTASDPYVDAVTGEGYSVKPEEMTHLRGNLLVAKTHPRIAFRGMLDVLEGEIISLQLLSHEAGNHVLGDKLEEVLQLVRRILAAEVKEEALPPFSLWGMDEAQLRKASHNVRQSVGIDHPVPSWRMGRLCAELNLLRGRVRQTELCAAEVFQGDTLHQDIILALNRLSSGVYLLFCTEVSNHG